MRVGFASIIGWLRYIIRKLRNLTWRVQRNSDLSIEDYSRGSKPVDYLAELCGNAGGVLLQMG